MTAHPRHDGAPAPAYTISQLNRKVAAMFEDRIPTLWVTGEVATASVSAAGHAFFTLKDAESEVSCALFAKTREVLGGFEPRVGQQLLVQCKVVLWASRGRFQLEIRHAEVRGLGRLRLEFEALKQRLAAEGLFDPGRKKPMPPLPMRVALVTSPVGAAVQDMITSIHARWPATLYIMPVRVQGPGAGTEIATAIARLSRERHPVDLVVVGRGGGSLEDLWAFNEEVVARAIARSKIPVVSAVGHDVDQSISDLVADRTVPTPTAVGSVFPDEHQIARALGKLARRCAGGMHRALSRARAQVTDLAGRRVLADPRGALSGSRDHLARTARVLARAMGARLAAPRRALGACAAPPALAAPDRALAPRRGRVERAGRGLALAARAARARARAALERAAAGLDALSPLAVLARGYSITLAGGRALRRWDEAPPGTVLATRLATGRLESVVARGLPDPEGPIDG